MRSLLDELAAELGFVHLGSAPLPAEAPRFEAFARWLEAGHHGELGYLERGLAERRDPRVRLPSACSVAVLALEHHHARPPDPGGLTGKVARYAWGRDYHNLVGKRLRKLRKRLRARGIESWGGVDTAPILERAWASYVGVGFTGKNGLSIVPARGSWMLLAVLFLDTGLEARAPLGDHCGSCRRCLDVCPTQAFVDARVLDARRCISTWTIESRGAIPVELREGIGRWVFGCDLCQEVCPHNAAPPTPDEDDLLPRNAWLDLPWLLQAPDKELAERFRGTPLMRPGPEGLRRNACVVLGNLGAPEAVPLLEQAAAGTPLVAEHARWALERLAGPAAR